MFPFPRKCVVFDFPLTVGLHIKVGMVGTVVRQGTVDQGLIDLLDEWFAVRFLFFRWWGIMLVVVSLLFLPFFMGMVLFRQQWLNFFFSRVVFITFHFFILIFEILHETWLILRIMIFLFLFSWNIKEILYESLSLCLRLYAINL